MWKRDLAGIASRAAVLYSARSLITWFGGLARRDMADDLSDLPSYPKKSEPELPPSRREWGTAIWVTFIVLGTATVAAIVHWLVLPGIGVFAFAPQSLFCILVGLALCGFAMFLVFLYVWQRSERQDK